MTRIDIENTRHIAQHRVAVGTTEHPVSRLNLNDQFVALSTAMHGASSQCYVQEIDKRRLTKKSLNLSISLGLGPQLHDK